MSKYNNAAIRSLEYPPIRTVKEARGRFHAGGHFTVDCFCNRDIDGKTVRVYDYDKGEYAKVMYRNKVGWEQSVTIKVK